MPEANSPATDAAVRVMGVDKTFGASTTDEVRALSGIDLTVASGEFVSLIGPSGCGKSTLLRLIGDLLEPTAGTVEVFGKPAQQARLDRDYGMAFQTAGLFPWRKVGANIELPLELAGVSKAERQQRTAEMLELVKLPDFGNHYPRQLSGGMQQRIAIARALSFEPRLLLMDEPFGALDEMTREHMQAELISIKNKLNNTIVFVTHSVSEAAFLSDRVVILSPRPGRIHQIVDVELGARTAETRQDPEFFKYVTDIRAGLRSVEELS